MKLVKIFVASSNELENDRVHLGDYVRKINDLYEPRGVRVRLYKWENFSPNYTGKRSQDEYNAYLRQCNAVIGLFKKKLGDYTCEEIKEGLKVLGKDSVYCYAKISGAESSVPEYIVEFFTSVGVDAQTYAETSDLEHIVEKVVEDAIKRGVPDNPYKRRRTIHLYATIPDDNSSQRPIVGDAIRSLDDQREEFHNDRCKLHPMRCSELISSSHLFMAFLKDGVEEIDANEIRNAKEYVDNSSIDAMVVYYDPTGAYKNSRFWNEVNKWGYFMPEYKGISDVKFHISNFMDRRRVTCANDYVVERGTLISNGVHIGNIGDVTSLKQNSQVVEVLAEQKKQIQELSSRITELGESINTKTDDRFIDLSIDIKTVDEQLQRIILPLLLQHSITIEPPKNARTLKLESMRKIKRTQEAMCKLLINGEITEIELNHEIELITPQLVKALERDWITKEKYFEIQSAFLLFFEKYFNLYPLERYVKTVDFADRYNIINLRTEEIREKIAQIYCQQGKFALAISTYRKALDNYHKLDDESVAFRRRLGQSFLDYCSIFLNYELTGWLPKLLETLEEWRTLVARWYQEDNLFLPEKAYYMAVLLRVQNMYNCFDEKQFNLQSIKETYSDVLSIFNVLSEKAKQNIIYLGNLIVTLYLDHRGELVSVDDDDRECQHYLDLTIEKAWLCYKTNPQGSLVYLASLYHNYGFLLVKQENLVDSIPYYEKAIDVRRQMFRKNNTVQAGDELAESLVNYGDLLRQIKYYPKAEDAAVESIKLYEASKAKSYQKLDVHDMNIYKSKQLLGSILYEMGGEHKLKAIQLLQESWDWNVSHPLNTYRHIFVGVSGRILKKEGLI